LYQDLHSVESEIRISVVKSLTRMFSILSDQIAQDDILKEAEVYSSLISLVTTSIASATSSDSRFGP